MHTALLTIQIVVAVTLTGVLLLQVKGTSAGVFGPAQSSFRVRRGLEKLLFQSTIGLVVIFVVLGIIAVKIS